LKTTSPALLGLKVQWVVLNRPNMDLQKSFMHDAVKAKEI
jgi:hypothetical protein